MTGLGRGAKVSAWFLLALFFISLFAPWLARYPYDFQEAARALASPDSHNWLGADELGRDLYSRLIFGARVSMFVGVAVAFFSLLIGGAYGAAAAWAGGFVEAAMMRAIDVVTSVPWLIVLILAKMGFEAIDPFDAPEVRALFGLTCALTSLGWLGAARMARALTKQALRQGYVESARSLGATRSRLFLRHILPNLAAPLATILTLQIPATILFESLLSFIGLGLQPPYASWGTLARDGWSERMAPHLIFFPGLALTLVVLAFGVLGDGLRDALDPYARSRFANQTLKRKNKTSPS